MIDTRHICYRVEFLLPTPLNTIIQTNDICCKLEGPERRSFKLIRAELCGKDVKCLSFGIVIISILQAITYTKNLQITQNTLKDVCSDIKSTTTTAHFYIWYVISPSANNLY